MLCCTSACAPLQLWLTVDGVGSVGIVVMTAKTDAVSLLSVMSDESLLPPPPEYPCDPCVLCVNFIIVAYHHRSEGGILSDDRKTELWDELKAWVQDRKKWRMRVRRVGSVNRTTDTVCTRTRIHVYDIDLN